ncbi:MAG: dihydroorotate dehydrogenase [Caulobacterales bacterium 68-7]|nr:DUF952 domain-containing protein [Caulobacterales bacterium]OJU13544.1 MAG: dihydroorotate dehydrogenase [Caulobacterales bacterium 68-7]
MTRIYKLLSRAEWDHALALGRFEGSEVDLADGYIHFSTGAQAPETARRYFAGRDDLMLVAVEAEPLGEALKWEPSRGGDLFPHLYAPLEVASAVEVRPLGLGPDGAPDLGDLT